MNKNPAHSCGCKPITAISAVAPAGGCNVSVYCMRTVDIATANRAATERSRSTNNMRIIQPTIEQIN